MVVAVALALAVVIVLREQQVAVGNEWMDYPTRCNSRIQIWNFYYKNKKKNTKKKLGTNWLKKLMRNIVKQKRKKKTKKGKISGADWDWIIEIIMSIKNTENKNNNKQQTTNSNKWFLLDFMLLL